MLDGTTSTALRKLSGFPGWFKFWFPMRPTIGSTDLPSAVHARRALPNLSLMNVFGSHGWRLDRLLRRALRPFRSEAPSPPQASAIPVVDDPETLIPGVWDRDITLTQCGWRWGHPYNDNELILLCHLAAAGYTPVVEFGTFDGRTTCNLAMNASQSTVLTIDLPTAEDNSNTERRGYGPYVSGERIAKAAPDVRARIIQIREDSRTADLSEWYGQAGLVFIDGGHSVDVCRHDTEQAFKLLRPGGIIGWDDYTPYWPGVKAVVDELSRRLTLHHLPRYGLVLYIAPEGGRS